MKKKIFLKVSISNEDINTSIEKFDFKGNLIYEKRISCGDAAQTYIYHYLYSCNTNVLITKTRIHNGKIIENQYDYDNNGKIVLKCTYENSEEVYCKTYEYDEKTGLLLMIQSAQSEELYTYNEQGLITSEKCISDGKIFKTTEYIYDSEDRLIKEVYNYSDSKSEKNYKYKDDLKIIIEDRAYKENSFSEKHFKGELIVYEKLSWNDYFETNEYNSENKLLKVIRHFDNGIEKVIKEYSYENGLLSSKYTALYDDDSWYECMEFYENGVICAEYSEIKGKEIEYTNRFNENGDLIYTDYPNYEDIGFNHFRYLYWEDIDSIDTVSLLHILSI